MNEKLKLGFMACNTNCIHGLTSDCICRRQVSYQEGEEFARNNGLLFSETSAKVNENVHKVSFLLINESWMHLMKMFTTFVSSYQVFKETAGKILSKIESRELDISNEAFGIKPGVPSGGRTGQAASGGGSSGGSGCC